MFADSAPLPDSVLVDANLYVIVVFPVAVWPPAEEVVIVAAPPLPVLPVASLVGVPFLT